MQTTVQLTLEDWKALSRAVGRRQWWFWSGLLAFVGLIMLRDAFNRYFSFRRALEGAPVTFSDQVLHIAIGAFAWSLAWAAMRYYTRVRAMRAPMFRAPSVMRASGDGFSRTTLEISKAIGWSEVHKLVETSTHLFILTDPKTAFVIPKNAFGSEAEATQFIDYVRQQTANARADKPPIAQP